jgi:hypothetical protein
MFVIVEKKIVIRLDVGCEGSPPHVRFDFIKYIENIISGYEEMRSDLIEMSKAGPEPMDLGEQAVPEDQTNKLGENDQVIVLERSNIKIA